MTGLSTEKCDIYILDNGRTVSDFIDHKIKERGLKENEEPFHVVNLDSVLKQHHRWISNLPCVKPFYAVKCNSTPGVLRVLSALGAGFDCASKGELHQVLSLGVKPDNIIYAHATKPLSHIKYACTHGVNTVTFDGEDELLKISLCHPQAKLLLRIAADDSSSTFKLSLKFGAKLETAGRLLEHAAKLGLNIIGVSFHVGSRCNKSLVFKKAIADARHVFDTAKMFGFQMSLLDIGGGFSGVEDFQVTFQEFSEAINGALDEFFPLDSGVQIIAEPGRYYVESAFTLAANVIAKRVIIDDVKEETEKDSPDRLMMYYLSDGVYGSLNCILYDPGKSEVEPYLHRVVESSKQRYRSTIWGPTCDSIDKITDNYWIPELYVGDWLLFDNMGAYSVSLASDFNGFERAHIYCVATDELRNTLNLF